MDTKNIPFGVTDWNDIEATEHIGETGIAYWGTKHFGPIRVRMVEYSETILPITGVRKDIFCFVCQESSRPNSTMDVFMSSSRE